MNQNILIVVYNDVIYESVDYWFPLSKYERPIDVQDYEEPNWTMKGYLYDDNKELFLYADNLFFHRSDEALPYYQSAESIEKIVIRNAGNDGEDIVMNGADVSAFITQISDYEETEEELDIKESVGIVEVYYKDYPACQWIGELICVKNGSLAFYMYDEVTGQAEIFSGVLIDGIKQF